MEAPVLDDERWGSGSPDLSLGPCQRLRRRCAVQPPKSGAQAAHEQDLPEVLAFGRRLTGRERGAARHGVPDGGEPLQHGLLQHALGEKATSTYRRFQFPHFNLGALGYKSRAGSLGIDNSQDRLGRERLAIRPLPRTAPGLRPGLACRRAAWPVGM